MAYLKTFLLALGVILQNAEAVQVSVEQGTLEGEQLTTITGLTQYNSFKGIPYAAPPVGDLRFKDPQSPSSWEGVRNATAHGNICPQYNKLTSTYLPGDEDCLFLNVYAPVDYNDSMVVMVWIHGGGFEYGSGNDALYGPDFLVDKGVILVTMNYRLDIPGFITTATADAPGNAGLKDQVAALRWVQTNIAQFGGDPTKVTLFGEGGGAVAVTLHCVSPMSAGLFQRAIPMTGSTFSEYNVAFEQDKRAFYLGKSLGLDTTNATELIEYLRTFEVEKLLSPNASIVTTEQFMDFVAKDYSVNVIEEDFGQDRFLTEDPNVSLANGDLNTVDFLLGFPTAIAVTAIPMFESSTSQMFRSYDRYHECLVPRSIFYNTTPKQHVQLGDLIKDQYYGTKPINISTMANTIQYFSELYIYPVVRYAIHLANCNESNNVYFYQFGCVSDRNVLTAQAEKYGIEGCSHTDDLNYVFNPTRYNLTVDLDSTSYKMVDQFTTLLTNFAKYGNPTPDDSLGVTWPQFDETTQSYLNITADLTVSTKPKESVMTFWEYMFELVSQPF